MCNRVKVYSAGRKEWDCASSMEARIVRLRVIQVLYTI